MNIIKTRVLLTCTKHTSKKLQKNLKYKLLQLYLKLNTVFISICSLKRENKFNSRTCQICHLTLRSSAVRAEWIRTEDASLPIQPGEPKFVFR